MERSPYRDASALLNAFFDSRTIGAGMQYVRMESSWRTIVGEKIAAHSRPGDIERGILHVEVEHPGWIQLLQMQQSTILASVRKAYPELEIHGIVFRIEKEPGRGRIPERAPAPERADLREDRHEATGHTSVLDGKVAGPVLSPEVVGMFEGLRRLIEKREAVGRMDQGGDNQTGERHRPTD